MAEAPSQNNKNRSRTSLVVLTLIFLGYLVVMRARSHRAVGLMSKDARKPLPELTLHTTDGSLWRSADHRGEVVVINLWATWCGPCQQEVPMLSRVASDMRPQGVNLVGISLDEGDRERKVAEFARRVRVTYPIAFPEEMSQMATSMDGLPTTILVDRMGDVALTYVGAIDEKELRSDLGRLLRER